MKVKYVNAYIMKNGKKVVCIKTEDDQVLFINEGLLAYACQNAKPVKDKAENKPSSPEDDPKFLEFVKNMKTE